ncbi:putative NBD/HSP70 family sugar kinase [Gracilibacillus halotolerans]|uniref:Putative NBD/HSP70 family sugar kinase n=1 Tax=Gracilibacillus halotolerans TaxID=74386 RepID=A0A841RK29_9BACI|nr:ROK family transcriptional regulator [Gracilibacillus halotolerans]MBB6512217.1 putative NBD/HSP70 family sugar kinase [Gracilibacillus halotolerans]
MSGDMKGQTWNQHVVKKENKTLVLQTIKEKAPISRASIAQVTGLNKGTVSSLVSELIDEDFIHESGTGESSGGRRPVMLLLNEKAGFTISVDLGVNKILGVMTDISGNRIMEKEINVDDNSVYNVSDDLFSLIDHLKEQAPSSRYGIIGIGVAVPGVVTTEGEILLAPNLGWKKVQLKDMLYERYKLPIIVENEANAGAYGEFIYGAGQNSKELIYISASIGIGVGLILDGKLYKGLRGFSGEFGHMTIEKDGLACRCGNRGCWELYASENALLEASEQHGLKNHSITDLVTKAEMRDTNALKVFEQIGDYLGVGITNIIHIFNPEQVIIGGSLAEGIPLLLPSIKKRIKQNAIGFNLDDVHLNEANLNKYSVVLGITAFNIENFFRSTVKEVSNGV